MELYGVTKVIYMGFSAFLRKVCISGVRSKFVTQEVTKVISMGFLTISAESALLGQRMMTARRGFFAI